MRPFTKTGERNDEEMLRSNWRGNACSKQRDKFKKSKGSIRTWSPDETVGNKNYRRKKADKANKHTYRRRLKEDLRKEIKDL